jgi:hypothetical protein
MSKEPVFNRMEFKFARPLGGYDTIKLKSGNILVEKVHCLGVVKIETNISFPGGLGLFWDELAEFIGSKIGKEVFCTGSTTSPVKDVEKVTL